MAAGVSLPVTVVAQRELLVYPLLQPRGVLLSAGAAAVPLQQQLVVPPTLCLPWWGLMLLLWMVDYLKCAVLWLAVRVAGRLRRKWRPRWACIAQEEGAGVLGA